jgi:hypothetical protein
MRSIKKLLIAIPCGLTFIIIVAFQSLSGREEVSTKEELGEKLFSDPDIIERKGH